MEGLPPIASSMAEYHFQDAAVTPPSSVLTPVCGHFRSYKYLKTEYQDSQLHCKTYDLLNDRITGPNMSMIQS